MGLGAPSVTCADEVSGRHRVDARGEFVDIGDLKPGEKLTSPDGSQPVVTKVQRYSHFEPVYDLTVDGVHTYYVVARTAPVLVHNCGASTWTPDANYSPEAVAERVAGNVDRKAFHETPQDIHDLVADVVSDPSYPQRMTGSAGSRVPDFYGAYGAPRSAQVWAGSKIYDNGEIGSQARVLVDSRGNIAYAGRRRDGSHNYNQIISYPWAKRP